MDEPLPRVRPMEVDHSFRSKPHHCGKRFQSPPSPHQDGRHSREMIQVLWELMRRGNAPLSDVEGHLWSREEALRGLEHHLSPSGETSDEASIPLTWLGQSCFYFRLGGLGIVTDPFLGKRASPLQFSGPKRLVISPLGLNDLQVDVIVMSHNHYDHFCSETLSQVSNKTSVLVITTLGLKPLFESLGYCRVLELDWYHQVSVGEVSFYGLPAYHFSGRSLLDADATLWASFGIDGPEGRLFFAGDTGYGPAFREIGELTGPYDIALVPIGAYAPRSVFAAVHASPEEAVAMGQDLGARRMVGMHWGTVRLTTEPFWEPRDKFLHHPGGPDREILAIGETRIICW
ncbi:MBL fold metallo-hydrolase [Hahella ganghwensis]|uniref:MBL fold metallo-hydrolase n=1 Tax=Hahella ganghwensis TaxID=286420 RepID=UPI0003AA2450|nr:MBL fold metallo-hydrolase [Hahella ganghwensis]